jgi:hypothetical protein
MLRDKIDVFVMKAALMNLAPAPAVTAEYIDRASPIDARGAKFTVQKALPPRNDGGSLIPIE